MPLGPFAEFCQSLPIRASDCIREFLLSHQRIRIGCTNYPTRFLRENSPGTSRRWPNPQRKPRQRQPGAVSCPRGVSGPGGEGRSPDSWRLHEHPLEVALFRGRLTVVQRRVSGQGRLDGSLPSGQTEPAKPQLGARSATLHSAHRIHNNSLRRSPAAIGATEQA